MTRRVEAAVLIVTFGALLLSGVRGGWLVGRLDNIGVPQEFLAVEQRLRVIALAQVVFGRLGLCSSVAVFIGKRWSYAALAVVLTVAAVVGGLASGGGGSDAGRSLVGLGGVHCGAGRGRVVSSQNVGQGLSSE